MGLSKSQCKAVQELLLHQRSQTLKLWFTFCNEIEYSAENDSYFLSDQFVVVGNMYLISSPFIHWLLCCCDLKTIDTVSLRDSTISQRKLSVPFLVALSCFVFQEPVVVWRRSLRKILRVLREGREHRKPHFFHLLQPPSGAAAWLAPLWLGGGPRPPPRRRQVFGGFHAM